MTARVIKDDDPRELYRWALAGLIVLAAHLALVATFVLLRKPDELAAGAPVVLVELAPVPAAPAEQPLDLPQVVENTPPQPQPVEQEVQPTPPEPETTPPEPEAQPTPPEPQVAALPEPVPEPPPPVPAAEVVLPTPPEKPVEEKVEPPPKPREVPKKDAKKERPKKKTTPPRAASAAPTRSAAPASPQQGVAARSNATDGDWRSRLIAVLQRSKRYPAGAQSRREQGTAVLSFTMDRNGRVLSRHIARSSGVAELDAEVMALVMRAQPLPPFPASMSQPRMTLSVPIRFSVR